MKAYAWVAVLSVVGACSQPSNDPKPIAIEELSRAYSCPKERVTATVRADLSAYAIDHTPQTPPADVAADPQRLAVWKVNEEKQSPNDRVVEARGCDKHVFYICGPATGPHDSQIMACRLASHPPAP